MVYQGTYTFTIHDPSFSSFKSSTSYQYLVGPANLLFSKKSLASCRLYARGLRSPISERLFQGNVCPLAFEERGVFFKERNAAIRQRIEQLFLTFILIFSYIYIRSRISDNYDTVTEKEILGPQVCLRKGSI